MNTHTAWLIYGATGDTGRLIVEEAVRRGHKPVLAGRSEGKLRALAEPLDLEWTTFGLDDPQALYRAARDKELILNVAGPFSNTSAPIVQACLAAGVPYLDVANEVEVFEALYAQDEAARQHGIALITGVGFGVTTSDCLAMYVANQVPGAQELEVAISLYNAHESPSAMLTRTRAMASGGRVRRAGQLEHVALGAGGRRMPFPDGTHTILLVPLADVVSSYRSTGIPNVTAYMTFAVNPFIARMALPVMQKLAAVPAVQQMLARPNHSPTEPEMQTAPQHSYIWAHASDGKGHAAEAWLETGEGYGYSATAAVRAVEQVLQHQPVGALTPAQAFGPDFPLTIPGVRRFAVTEPMLADH